MPTEIALAGTGAALGVVHVLTGPDHLSALATLSANVGSCPQAFVLGARWGIGHSTGLLLVGIVLIVITRNDKDDDDDKIEMPDQATTFFESLVGAFMILLGAWGIRRAFVKRSKVYDIVPPELAATSSDGSEVGNSEINVYSLDAAEFIREGGVQQPSCHDPERCSSFDDTEMTGNSSSEEHYDETTRSNHPTFPTFPQDNCCNSIISRMSARTLAFCAGIIHGLAGPGGILGVLPAVQLHNGLLASIFLGCFCLSSTLTMGVFATIYGTLTSKLVGQHRLSENPRRREFWVELISAILSVLVGVLWIALLSTGKLEEVFP